MFIGTAALAVGTCTAAANGQPARDAYCAKVRARAVSDADLLMSPRVLVQGIRFPQSGQQVDVGPTAGSGYQLRAGFSFSPIDFYRGLGVLRLSDADCARHAASTKLEDVILHGADVARLAALRAQTGFLEDHAPEWRALSAKAAARLAERVITLPEYASMEQYVDTLEHKLVRVAGEARQLEAEGMPSPEQPLPTMAQQYVEQSMGFEREASRLRSLEAWKFQVTGGLIPQAPVDWFGIAEVTFNVGAIAQRDAENRYLEWRAEELRHARDELQSQVERFGAQTDAALDQARHDLEVVQHSIDVLANTRLILDRSADGSATHARDTLAVEQLSIESDGVFLRALIDALAVLAARGVTNQPGRR